MFDNYIVTAFEKRKDRQENSTNSGGCLADDSTTISSSLKDSTATDCEGLTSSATSTPSSAFLLLKQQRLSLSDEDEKIGASASISVDDNVDVAMLNSDEITTGNYSTINQAAIIKRYKMERKNSQQSSHSKMVSTIL